MDCGVLRSFRHLGLKPVLGRCAPVMPSWAKAGRGFAWPLELTERFVRPGGQAKEDLPADASRAGRPKKEKSSLLYIVSEKPHGLKP